MAASTNPITRLELEVIDKLNGDTNKSVTSFKSFTDIMESVEASPLSLEFSNKKQTK